MMYEILCTIASLYAIVGGEGAFVSFVIKLKWQIISFRMQKRQYGWFFYENIIVLDFLVFMYSCIGGKVHF